MIEITYSKILNSFSITCRSSIPTAMMGMCGLSFRTDEPNQIVDLEEILINEVNNNRLSLAQRTCVGNTIYLEVCISRGPARRQHVVRCMYLWRNCGGTPSTWRYNLWRTCWGHHLFAAVYFQRTFGCREAPSISRLAQRQYFIQRL